MISLRSTIYQNIIKKKHQDKLAKMLPEKIVHEELKDCWRELIVVVVSLKGCLWNFSNCNSNLVVSRFQVNLAKDPCPIQFIDELLDDRDEKFV